MNRKTRKYAEEFKEEVIKLALKSPSVGGIARELGIPGATLHGWIKKVKNSEYNKLDLANGKNMVDLIEENKRLHKALAIAQEEREILKKAATLLCTKSKVWVY